MSYAIIRNTKYKIENLKGIYRHNERRNKNYSNKNINPELSYLNYSLKDCKYSYEKEFDLIKKRYNLKGQIKTVSNIACEYIITSNKEYFNSIGMDETKRYFETAYMLIYNNLYKTQKLLCFCENSNIKIGYQFLCCYFLTKFALAYLVKI